MYKGLLAVVAVISLSACTTTESMYAQKHDLLVQAEKGANQMEAGLAQQASGAALAASGKQMYTEGKEAEESALQELNELLK